MISDKELETLRAQGKSEAWIRINTDYGFCPSFPDDDIICKDCKHRKPDFVTASDGSRIPVKGFKNGYCEIYTKETNGKPNKILFNHSACDYYEKGGHE